MFCAEGEKQGPEESTKKLEGSERAASTNQAEAKEAS